jgi:hypothetical protein
MVQDSPGDYRSPRELDHAIRIGMILVTKPTDSVECIRDKSHGWFASFNQGLNNSPSSAKAIKIGFNLMVDLNIVSLAVHW